MPNSQAWIGGHGCPVDDLCPLGVAIGDNRSERLLGDDLGEDARVDVHVGGEGGELRCVGGPDLALPGLEGRVELVVRLELDRRERNAEIAEDGVEVEQRGVPVSTQIEASATSASA